MSSAIKYFIDRPVIVNLITVMLILAGIASAYTLKKELFPPVDFDVILINTIYPGSSSEDVEKLVTISLERKLKEVDGLNEINALSAEGRSIIYIEVDPDYDIDKVMDDVKVQIDSVDDLPDDAKVPIITSLTNRTRGIMKITLTGGTYNELRNTAKKLRDDIERMNEIAKVTLEGYEVDVIKIKIDPEKLKRLDVTISEVKQAITDRNLNLSAGSIEAPGGDIMVRTVAEFGNLDEVRNVVIRSNNTGKKIKVSDVAKVVREPEDDSVINRSMGSQAIFLDLKIKENADIIKSTDKVKQRTLEFLKKYDLPQKVQWTDDRSFFVKRRLNILVGNGVVGIILVLGCLLLFLNFSTSVMTSLGAPLAFFISFLVMDASGLTINLISMFGLILVLGMLVDDSIIVAEHFYQHLEEGKKPKEAAEIAANETVRPILATILTTIVAFGSIFFMGGIMGKFLWQVPAVVIICLSASLFECFFILPSHLADFCKLTKEKGSRWYDPVIRTYKNSLLKFTKFPFTTVSVYFVIFIASLVLAKTMRFELFPGDDIRTIFFQVKGPVGAPLEKTDRIMQRLEKLAKETLREDELDQYTTKVGSLFEDRRTKTGSHYGSLIVYLTSPDMRERSTEAIIKEFSSKAKPLVENYVFNIVKQQGGPPRGKDIEIEIQGDSLEELKVVSAKVLALLKENPNVTASEIDFEEGKNQIVVEVDDEEARRLGLSTRQIALLLRGVLSGDSVTEIRESDEDIEIKIMFDDDAKKKISSLENLYISNATGGRIPITKVVKFKEVPGAFIIRRLNRKRIFSVIGTINKRKTTPIKIAKELTPKVQKIMEDHPEITYNFGGENEDTAESVLRLAKAGSIAMFCIFLILVIMFGSLAQPLIIMTSIPLGLVGVIISFKILGESLGFMALLGVIGLVGVVVNDSIVLVNFINKQYLKTGDLVKSVVEASVNRLRPVLLTTFTTVAGLLPIAHDPGGDPFLKPMAKAFAWGLLFATFVTLVFIPCAFILQKRMAGFFSSLLNRSNLRRDDNAGATGA